MFYLYVTGAVAALVAGFIAWRRLRAATAPDPTDTVIADRNAAIDARKRAREAAIELGAEQAKKLLLAEYAQRRQHLDKEQETRIQELSDGDIEDLAAAIELATRRPSDGQ